MTSCPTISRNALDRRGWNHRRIDALGEPDAIIPMPNGTESPQWLVSRIELIEQADPELTAAIARRAAKVLADEHRRWTESCAKLSGPPKPEPVAMMAVRVAKATRKELRAKREKDAVTVSRTTLQQLNGQTLRCRATVERFGKLKSDPSVKTVLLCNVHDATTGKRFTDHLWFPRGPWSEGLQPAFLIEFDARATRYMKGYQGMHMVFGTSVRPEWNLTDPTDVVVIERYARARPRPSVQPEA